MRRYIWADVKSVGAAGVQLDRAGARAVHTPRQPSGTSIS